MLTYRNSMNGCLGTTDSWTRSQKIRRSGRSGSPVTARRACLRNGARHSRSDMVLTPRISCMPKHLKSPNTGGNPARMKFACFFHSSVPSRTPAGTRAETTLRRTLHGGWNAAGSRGECEELSAQGCQERRSAGRSWQCDGGLPRGEAVEPDARIEDGPGCEDGTQRQGQGSQAELQRESAGGEP